MGYMDVIRDFSRKIKDLALKTSQTSLQPKEILQRIYAEVEKRKKLGIEENLYVPNAYAIYLSPIDHEELSPFLLGIKEQLIKKVTERIRNKGYKLLSSGLSLEIR
jgi:hypothetical protein